MITEIGIVAGEIWHYLDQHRTPLATQVAAGIQRSNEVVLMSLGWLAREGHVILTEDGADYRIELRH